MLLQEIDRYCPASILEVGCGNSKWLPYLAKKRSLSVFGLDYSEEGCELVRRLLKAEKIDGTIFCQDMFTAQPSDIGQFDFVYSLGVVEHFSDLKNALSQLMKFVKPGGVLLTEVPNMHSLHGLLVCLYQPELFAKHRLIGKKELHDAHTALGIKEVRSAFLGLFSMGIVAWGIYQRFTWLDKIVLPIVQRLSTICEIVLKKIRSFQGIYLLAPFIYAVGHKPEEYADQKK